MSVENSIRDLYKPKQQLNENGDVTNPKQGNSQSATYSEMDPHKADSGISQTNTRKKGPNVAQTKQGDSEDPDYDETEPQDMDNAISQTNTRKKGSVVAQKRQGNSKDASYSEMNPYIGEELEEMDIENLSEEELMELDKKTLASYIKKAAIDQGDNGFDIEYYRHQPGYHGEYNRSMKRLKKRNQGISRATDRLVKEDIYDIENLRKDIASVFEGDESLTEEFKTQAETIFEAAVVSRVNAAVESLTEELQEELLEQYKEDREELIEQMNAYLSYVAEEWIQENELAIEEGIRTEIAEGFMEGLKNLFKEHYFEVPEDRVDVLVDMAEETEALKEELNQAIKKNMQLSEELIEIKKESIIMEEAHNLTDVEEEKLANLMEGIEFNDIKSYRQKVRLVKERHFGNNKINSPEQYLEESMLGQGATLKEVSPNIERYVASLSRTARK